MPAEVGLLANDALLPGAVPDASQGYGWDWQRRFLRCSPTQQLDGLCGPDSDGDGWPADTDCDDSDPTIHPDQSPEPPGSSTDLNCDTWHVQL